MRCNLFTDVVAVEFADGFKHRRRLEEHYDRFLGHSNVKSSDPRDEKMIST